MQKKLPNPESAIRAANFTNVKNF